MVEVTAEISLYLNIINLLNLKIGILFPVLYSVLRNRFSCGTQNVKGSVPESVM